MKAPRKPIDGSSIPVVANICSAPRTPDSAEVFGGPN